MTLVLLLDLREYSPLIKYKAGFPRLIPQISTVLKNEIIPKISSLSRRKTLEKIQASKLFVGPVRRTTSVKTLPDSSVDIVDTNL
jgi:hypothetical protein